ncbi:MAG: 50S ribosomal protein L9 [Termitinemataceae bacterium]|nr:MAG: 50S ribosomal protein L9 [Termitinemataceae bacterium]
MKVILNKDLATLGEEGDIKDVARGYARNFLFPRGIALPYTERTIKLFEARKDEIEARKAQKHKDAASLQERLELLEISITMPAGANGKLYGAVTSHSVADELAKSGFQIERKRIEIPGNSIKNVGKYKLVVKLYGNTQATITLNVIAQPEKVEEKKEPPKKNWHRNRDENAAETVAAKSDPAPDTAESGASEETAASPTTAE